MNPAINLKLPDEEYKLIVIEAGEANTSPTDYCRQIVLQRHERDMTIVPLSEENVGAMGGLTKKINKLEATIEILKEDKDKLQDRLEEARRAEGLSGISAKHEGKEESVKVQIKRERESWEREQQAKEHAKLVSDHAQLQKDYDEQELEDLRETMKFDQRLAGFMTVGGELATTVIAKNPELAARIGDVGLSGLLFGNRGGNVLSLGGMDEAHEGYLRLGKGINEEFGAETNRVIDMLKYLKKYPNVFQSIQSSAQFQQFMAGRQAA